MKIKPIINECILGFSLIFYHSSASTTRDSTSFILSGTDEKETITNSFQEPHFDNTNFQIVSKRMDTLQTSNYTTETINKIEKFYRDISNVIFENIDYEDDLIELIKSWQKDSLFYICLNYFFEKDNLFLCDTLLSTILVSGINIFTKDFKYSLAICRNSIHPSLSKKASDIMNYYKSGFEAI